MGAEPLDGSAYGLSLTLYGEAPPVCEDTLSILAAAGVLDASWRYDLNHAAPSNAIEAMSWHPGLRLPDLSITVGDGEFRLEQRHLEREPSVSLLSEVATRYMGVYQCTAWSATFRFLYADPTSGSCFSRSWPGCPPPFAGTHGLVGGEARFDFEGAANAPSLTVTLASAWSQPVTEPVPDAVEVAVAYYPGGDQVDTMPPLESLNRIKDSLYGFACDVASRWLGEGS